MKLFSQFSHFSAPPCCRLGSPPQQLGPGCHAASTWPLASTCPLQPCSKQQPGDPCKQTGSLAPDPDSDSPTAPDPSGQAPALTVTWALLWLPGCPPWLHLDFPLLLLSLSANRAFAVLAHPSTDRSPAVPLPGAPAAEDSLPHPSTATESSAVSGKPVPPFLAWRPPPVPYVSAVFGVFSLALSPCLSSLSDSKPREYGFCLFCLLLYLHPEQGLAHGNTPKLLSKCKCRVMPGWPTFPGGVFRTGVQSFPATALKASTSKSLTLPLPRYIITSEILTPTPHCRAVERVK